MKNNNLNLIQIYRGIASMMVLVLHLWTNIAFYYKDLDISSILKITRMGSFGVDFFFVLSGFIIFYSYKGKKKSLKSYFFNRILRIYLPYLPLAIVFLLGYHFFPNLSHANNSHSIIATITLIPIGVSALGQAWSLMHEMIFYTIFSISIIRFRIFIYFIIIWLIFTTIYLIMDIKTLNYEVDYFLYTFFSFYNFEFILGIICVLLCKNIPNLKHTLVFVVIFFLLFLFSYFYMYNIYLNKTFFSIFCFWILFYAYQQKDLYINPKNIFMKIGFSSYSIYLVHIPVIIILNRIIPHINVYLSFLVGFLSSIIIGIVYSYYFENKFLNYIKNV
jgi:exopolysaccharide production protein ExoZ